MGWRVARNLLLTGLFFKLLGDYMAVREFRIAGALFALFGIGVGVVSLFFGY
ncbi:hypothetical protein [Thermococcus chitonophagus]|nr:hypothetical protein [Thermococcus chitonophagus]